MRKGSLLSTDCDGTTSLCSDLSPYVSPSREKVWIEIAHTTLFNVQLSLHCLSPYSQVLNTLLWIFPLGIFIWNLKLMAEYTWKFHLRTKASHYMGFFSKLMKSIERESVTPNFIHIGRKYREWDNISFKVLTKVQFSLRPFHETNNYTTTSFGKHPHRRLPKSVRKYGNFW
jgi:hypothetical protein